MYSLRQVGAKNTEAYKLYLQVDNKPISPFHDIPLYADKQNGILNMVVEIPRWSNAKMEVSKSTTLNPITQDIKKGKVRFVRNCFPHKGYIWNYGAFPQTWEDPTYVHPDTKAAGDNDPLDVCEIGEKVAYTGQVKQVKVLGTVALLDEGETDWKVIVIDVTDPLASKLNDIEDVEKYMPGLMRATNEWFRIYKIPDGKKENVFAFGGIAKGKLYANDIVAECHEAWKKLILNKVPNKTDKYEINTANSAVVESPYRIPAEELEMIPVEDVQPDASVDPSVDKWFFISASS